MIDIKKIIAKKRTQIKFIIGAIGLIAASYLIYVFLLTPLFDEQERLRLQLDSQQKILKTRLENINRVDALERELDSTSGKLSEIEKRFLTEERVPAFFEVFRKLAESSYLTIQNLKVGEKQALATGYESKDFKYDQLPVDVSLNGSYMDIINFLINLKKELAVYNVSKISMYAISDQADSIKADLQLILYLVYEKTNK